MFIRSICARLLSGSLLAYATIMPAALFAQAEATDSSETPGTSISGPVLGFVFDPKAGVFRRVFGIPGAATLSDSLSVSAVVHRAEIARNFALATIGGEEAPAVIHLQDEPPSFHLIDGAPPAPSRMVLSPNGTAAALYYPAESKLRILSALSRTTSVIREIPIQEASAVTALAVSDNAETVLLGRSDDTSGSVSRISPDGSELFLASVTQPSAITFIGKSTDALVSDAASSTVYVVRLGAEQIETSVVGTAGDGLATPNALSAGNDSQWAFVVNAAGGTVIALDLTGGPSRTFTCPCEATGLHWLGQGTVFRLSDSSLPMWFVNASRAESPLFFVPPAADSSATPDVQQNGDAL